MARQLRKKKPCGVRSWQGELNTFSGRDLKNVDRLRVFVVVSSKDVSNLLYEYRLIAVSHRRKLPRRSCLIDAFLGVETIGRRSCLIAAFVGVETIGTGYDEVAREGLHLALEIKCVEIRGEEDCRRQPRDGPPEGLTSCRRCRCLKFRLRRHYHSARDSPNRGESG